MRALAVLGLLLLAGCREPEATYAAPDARAIEAAFRLTFEEAQVNRTNADLGQIKRNDEALALVGAGGGAEYVSDRYLDKRASADPVSINGDLKARAKAIVTNVAACKWGKTEELSKYDTELYGVKSRHGWICQVDFNFEGLDRACRRKTESESRKAMFYVADGAWRYSPAYSFGGSGGEDEKWTTCARNAAERLKAQRAKAREGYR